MRNHFSLLLTTSLLGGCSLAPDFELPEFSLPLVFAEQDDSAQSDQHWVKRSSELAAEDPWWALFEDAQLDALIAEAVMQSPSLEAAAARVEQARANAGAEKTTFLPKFTLGGNAVRAQPSGASAAAFGAPSGINLKPYNLFSGSIAASYELDLFGRVRDTEAALLYDAGAQDALYRGVLLALQADVAEHYFSIRALDSERALLRDTVNIREEALRIMQKRFDLGEAGEQDLTRTQAELAGTNAELIALDRARATEEHALAVLLGKLPSAFSLEEAKLMELPPYVPSGVPSALLERRPDIAAAQERMRAANARIGVARTGYFPRLILNASGGYESTTISKLFDWPNHVWALGQIAGNALTMTLFDSGRTGARYDAADAAYKESAANYKSQVLNAFREVEDALTAQRLLAWQWDAMETAATAAERTTAVLQRRYQEGDVSWFEVVDAQRQSLAARRGAVQTRSQRLIAAVRLIRALGGGWQNPPAPMGDTQ